MAHFQQTSNKGVGGCFDTEKMADDPGLGSDDDEASGQREVAEQRLVGALRALLQERRQLPFVRLAGKVQARHDELSEMIEGTLVSAKGRRRVDNELRNKRETRLVEIQRQAPARRTTSMRGHNINSETLPAALRTKRESWVV